jgi:hypothetical protein
VEPKAATLALLIVAAASATPAPHRSSWYHCRAVLDDGVAEHATHGDRVADGRYELIELQGSSLQFRSGGVRGT